VAINIKDPETDRLARELAALTGEPNTHAVRSAIEDRLAQLRRRQTLGDSSDLGGIITRGRQRQLLDERDEAEILGYDADGLPA
jgi:antitoxin VapB